MTPIMTDLEQVITDTPRAELPALIGVLAQLHAKAQLRMLTGHDTVKHEPEDLLTIPEVAKRLKISEYRAYELVRRGEIKKTRLGEKSVRVKPSDLAEYLGRQGA